jgi:metal-responsive CopG/Arc/MetJ family transcriptional regulator
MSVERPQGIIETSGQRGEPRRLDQMISVRLDPTLVAALKEVARRNGLSLSDVLRDAALLFLEREEARNVTTFTVAITNERSGAAENTSFRRHIPAAV